MCPLFKSKKVHLGTKLYLTPKMYCGKIIQKIQE